MSAAHNYYEKTTALLAKLRETQMDAVARVAQICRDSIQKGTGTSLISPAPQSVHRPDRVETSQQRIVEALHVGAHAVAEVASHAVVRRVAVDVVQLIWVLH